MENYLKELLGLDIYFEILNLIPVSKLTEIRIRLKRCISIRSRNDQYKLNKIVNRKLIDEVIGRVTKHSPYAYKDEMLSGYIRGECGIRIGVVGSYVTSHNSILTIKEITSLNIRLPHEIIGASSQASEILHDFDNTIVIAPPFGGKTTMIRDMTRVLSGDYDVVVIDERDEITGGGAFAFGDKIDIASSIPKNLISEAIIRSMSPEIVVMDEVYLDRENNIIEYLSKAGIKILAAIHGNGDQEFMSKLMNTTSIFTYAIVLSRNPWPGQIKSILRLK
ncbi:MAG: hypothetical protein LBF12_00355 [Christensenellaceae bacterium]|nr:hypothetical protein [Christensenellaceae bacterium]